MESQWFIQIDRVDIGVVIYDLTPHCRRSIFQVLVQNIHVKDKIQGSVGG